MALVSIQNFVAPFRNKTHLFTIIIVAALFGLWRATGGSVSLKSAHSNTVSHQNQPRNSAAPAAGTTTRSVAVEPTRGGGSQNLDDLLVPSAPAPAAPKPRPKSALDDIEKTLGMR